MRPTTKKGKPPLFKAARHGYSGVVDSLMAAGADVDTAGERSLLAILEAADEGKIGVPDDLDDSVRWV